MRSWNHHHKFVVHRLQFNQGTVGGNLGDDGLAQRVGNACVCVADHEVAIVIVDESDLQNPWAPQTNGGGCRPEVSFLFLRRFRDPRDSSRDSFIVLCGWAPGGRNEHDATCETEHGKPLEPTWIKRPKEGF